MKPLKLTITMNHREGDEVEVLNYRCKPAKWVAAKVQSVEVRISRTGQASISYHAFHICKPGGKKYGYYIYANPQSIR